MLVRAFIVGIEIDVPEEFAAVDGHNIPLRPCKNNLNEPLAPKIQDILIKAKHPTSSKNVGSGMISAPPPD